MVEKGNGNKSHFQLFPWAHQGQPVFSSIVSKFHLALRICNGNIIQIHIIVMRVFKLIFQILDQVALIIINFLFVLHMVNLFPVCPSRLLRTCFKFRRQLKKLFAFVYPLVCLLDFPRFTFCYVQHSRKFFQIHMFSILFWLYTPKFFSSRFQCSCAFKKQINLNRILSIYLYVFSRGEGKNSPLPFRLSCDNLGVKDLALLNGFAYSAIANKHTHKACHTLVGHRRFVRAIIFRNKGQFLEQVGHAVNPILFHLVICLISKFQLFGVYLRRAVLILVALGNGSKKRFKLFANFISNGFAIQDDVQSVRISHLVLFHSIILHSSGQVATHLFLFLPLEQLYCITNLMICQYLLENLFKKIFRDGERIARFIFCFVQLLSDLLKPILARSGREDFNSPLSPNPCQIFPTCGTGNIQFPQ